MLEFNSVFQFCNDSIIFFLPFCIPSLLLSHNHINNAVEDAFRVIHNLSIVLSLNGSVLHRPPVCMQSCTMDCQWQSEGC